jgi:hypothetical protein
VLYSFRSSSKKHRSENRDRATSRQTRIAGDVAVNERLPESARSPHLTRFDPGRHCFDASNVTITCIALLQAIMWT